MRCPIIQSIQPPSVTQKQKGENRRKLTKPREPDLPHTVSLRLFQHQELIVTAIPEENLDEHPRHLPKRQAVTGQHSERGEEPCRDPPDVRTMLQVEWGCASEPPPSSPPSLTNIQDYHNWQKSEECFCLRLSQEETEESALWTFGPEVVFLELGPYHLFQHGDLVTPSESSSVQGIFRGGAQLTRLPKYEFKLTSEHILPLTSLSSEPGLS